MSKRPKIIVLLLIIVLTNYILTRYVFFDLHGMKDFTDTMALISAALTCIFILSNNLLASLCSSVGNVIGFFLGYKFNTTTIDFITGNTNNYWLIWAISYLIIVLIGMILSKMFHVKHKEGK